MTSDAPSRVPEDWRVILEAGVERASQGDAEGAKPRLLHALRASRATGDPSVLLETLIRTGQALLDVGDAELARSTLHSGHQMAEQVGDVEAAETAERSLRALDGVPEPVSEPLRNTRGEAMPMSRRTYDAPRPSAAKKLGTLCHAPFVSVDFGPQGQVTVCNHYHKAMAQLGEDRSFLEIWRGEAYRELRRKMHDYEIDEDLCRHCARQIRAGSSRQTFAVQQYDAHPAESLEPPYPRLLTFRLSNRCNLACIMCDGSLSSRIRREREGRKPLGSFYGDRFFDEMKTVLPHVDHIEFFGGEPLIVDEHIRIFEILKQTDSKCSIYINTNGTALNEQSKRYLRELNFTTIAVSMDSTIAEVHSSIRVGVRHKLFLQNLAWLLELRESRPLHLLLNVTEQRGNWFDLPELFRFAARIEAPLHINTCIHPPHCTLYTLPTRQLAFVGAYLRRKQMELGAALDVAGNADSYQHLISLVESELDGRSADWEPPVDWLPKDPERVGTDGQLRAPIPGYPPFATPDEMAEELRLMSEEDEETTRELCERIAPRLEAMPPGRGWEEVSLRQ